MKRLHELCRLSSAAILDLARRNDSRQLHQRLLERDVRVGAVHLADEIIDQGYTRSEAAGLLKLCPRTLRQWQIDGHNRCLQVALLGRPLLRSSVHERHQVIDLLTELGPATGLPTLRQCFPLLARAELADLLRRYRRLWQDLHGRLVHCLRWPVPGRAWAMDFSDPPWPIDGRYPHLLAVRDLASGQQLLWQPVPNLTAAVAQQALASLAACHGAPLVLKIDNGSAFIDAATLALLCQLAVIPLFSPAYMPQYNGSVEAGNGSLKTRTEVQATLAGHPGYWTWDDVEAARLQANATSRPRGENGPTPDELWAERQPITTEERAIFQAVLDRRRLEARQEAGKAMEQTLDPSEHRSLDRQAIRRALGELGYLLFSRRRIPLPIRKRKVTGLS